MLNCSKEMKITNKYLEGIDIRTHDIFTEEFKELVFQNNPYILCYGLIIDNIKSLYPDASREEFVDMANIALANKELPIIGSDHTMDILTQYATIAMDRKKYFMLYAIYQMLDNILIKYKISKYKKYFKYMNIYFITKQMLIYVYGDIL